MSTEHRMAARSLASLHGASHTSSDRDHGVGDHHSDALALDGVSDASVNSVNETHPPSVVAREDNEAGYLAERMHSHEDDEAKDAAMDDAPPDMPIYLDETAEAAINRALRPGLLSHSPLRNASPLPDLPGVEPEGYNFDAYTPSSPVRNLVPMDHSYPNLPDDDPWSPAGQMHVSPIQARRSRDGSGSLGNGFDHLNQPPSLPMNGDTANEATPLLGRDVPPDIIIPRTRSDTGNSVTCPAAGCGNRQTIRSAVDSVFSGIRSEDESVQEEINNDCEHYLNSSIIARGSYGCVSIEKTMQR